MSDQSLTKTIGFRVNLTATEMRRFLDTRLRHLGITGQQWKILHFCTQEGIDIPGDLAKVMSIDGTAITRLLDRLEKQKLIHRLQNPDDRRSLKLEVSPAGYKVEKEATRIVMLASSEVTSGITEKDLEVTMRTLQALVDGVHRNA